MLPKGTPPAIRDRLYREIGDILKQPMIAARLKEMAAEPGGQAPPEFASFIAAETEKWRKVAKESCAKIE